MKKRGICLLLALLMTLSLLPFGALAASADDLKYTIIDGAVTITGCTNARGELVIPAAIEGRPVRAIGASAFDGCAYLTAVVIPEGVTTIGTRAFASCERMERVNLPTTLQSIGTGAFLACVSLKSVTIPEGLKTLSPYAFSVCEGLERVTIPEGVSVIQHEAFYGCSGLKEVTIPGSVSTVETLAFSACRKLTEVTFRGAAAKLEDDVFLDCTGLKHVFYAGTAQQWQELLMYDIMATDSDGLWTHMKFGYSVPRRNGKSELLIMRECWGLIHGERVLHTAHRTTTSHSTWEKVIERLSKMGYTEKEDFKTTKQFGLERIEHLMTGCHVRTV